MTNRGVVLVTGGGGFIGTWVLRELFQRGHMVVVIDPFVSKERWQRVLGNRASDVTVENVALTDRDGLAALIDQHEVSHIIHLAALLTPACQQDPWLGCQVNVFGSTSVFDAARKSGRIQAVSYASSYAVYGSETPDTNEVNKPPMFYGAFKQAVDLIAEQYWKHCGLRSVAVRPHVVYGPERDQGLTAGPSLACRAAVTNSPYTIGYTGTVGYDYVEDVALAFVKSALECPEGASVVDLPGQQATTEEFVRVLNAVVPEATGKIKVDGPHIPANIPPHPNYISNLFDDWKATSLLDGVRSTVDFYRSDSSRTDCSNTA